MIYQSLYEGSAPTSVFILITQPALSAMYTQALENGSAMTSRILDWRRRGFPFLFLDFAPRRASVAVVALCIC